MTTSYPCPICGEPYKPQVFTDSECYASCQSGHWSFTHADGLSTEVVGPKLWAWTATESQAEDERRHAEIKAAIAAHPDYAIGVGV